MQIMFPGNALLTLDLIIINHFISRLQSDNLLLELSLRDQVLENKLYYYYYYYYCVLSGAGGLRPAELAALPSPGAHREAQWESV